MKRKAHFKNLTNTFLIYCFILIFCGSNTSGVLAAGDNKKNNKSENIELSVHKVVEAPSDSNTETDRGTDDYNIGNGAATDENAKPDRSVTHELGNPVKEPFIRSMDRNATAQNNRIGTNNFWSYCWKSGCISCLVCPLDCMDTACSAFDTCRVCNPCCNNSIKQT